MKLKPIKYPTFNALKRFRAYRKIVESPAGYMEISLRNYVYGTIKEIAVWNIAGSSFPKRAPFPLTEEGYEEAKKLFENITFTKIKGLVEKWIDLED